MSGEALQPSLPPAFLLRRFLRAQGWRQTALGNGRTDLFSLPPNPGDSGELELFVPIAGTVEGAERYISLAVETLSELAGRDTPSTVRAILSIGFDQLLAHLPDGFRWSVPLTNVEAVIRATRRLLAYSAMNELVPENAAATVSEAGLQYAASCRFGHTFQGSFGLTIKSPVGPHEDLLLSEADHPPPPARRYMQRIARGCLLVAAAGEKGDPALILRNVAAGFNANMCEELIHMYQAAEADRLKLSFRFSPEWQSPADLAHVEAEIDARSVAVMKEAAQQLRGTTEPSPVTVRGPVQLLSATGNPADLEHPTGSRDIAVLWDGEFGLIKVRARLDPTSYLRAAAAHLAGQHVSVTGLLEKRGSRWSLRSPSNFAVIQ